MTENLESGSKDLDAILVKKLEKLVQKILRNYSWTNKYSNHRALCDLQNEIEKRNIRLDISFLNKIESLKRDNLRALIQESLANTKLEPTKTNYDGLKIYLQEARSIGLEIEIKDLETTMLELKKAALANEIATLVTSIELDLNTALSVYQSLEYTIREAQCLAVPNIDKFTTQLPAIKKRVYESTIKWQTYILTIDFQQSEYNRLVETIEEALSFGYHSDLAIIDLPNPSDNDFIQQIEFSLRIFNQNPSASHFVSLERLLQKVGNMGISVEKYTQMLPTLYKVAINNELKEFVSQENFDKKLLKEYIEDAEDAGVDVSEYKRFLSD